MSKAVSKNNAILVGLLVVLVAVVAYVVIVSSQPPKEVVTVRTVVQTVTAQGATVTQVQTTTATQKVDNVVFIQPWTPAGIYAPHWYGAHSGLFLQHGMQVTMASSSGSTDALKKLDLGLGQFTQADTAAWIKVTLEGSKAKAIGMYTIKNEANIIFNKNKIKTPKDLEGKTIGSPGPGNAAEAQFPIFAEKVGIAPSKIKFVNTTPAALVSLLGEGQFDAIFGTLPTVPTATRVGKEKGFEVSVFSYHDYGIVVFSNLIFTKEDIIKNNPDLVRRFLKAFYKAYKHSIEKPEDDVKIIIELNRGLNYENELDKMKDLITWNNPSLLFQTKPIGKIDDQLMKETVQNIAKQFKFQLPSEDFYKTIYTNEFLPNTLD